LSVYAYIEGDFRFIVAIPCRFNWE